MPANRETAYPDEPEDVVQARIAAHRFCRGKSTVHPDEVLGLAWIAHQRNLAKVLRGGALHTANAREIIDLRRGEDNLRRKGGHLYQHADGWSDHYILDHRPFAEPDEVQEAWASLSRRFAPDAGWRERLALYLVLVEGFRALDAAETVGVSGASVWAYLKKFKARAKKSRDL